MFVKSCLERLRARLSCPLFHLTNRKHLSLLCSLERDTFFSKPKKNDDPGEDVNSPEIKKVKEGELCQSRDM